MNAMALKCAGAAEVSQPPKKSKRLGEAVNQTRLPAKTQNMDHTGKTCWLPPHPSVKFAKPTHAANATITGDKNFT